MACHETCIECDYCGSLNATWTKFCNDCGLDYCDRCEIEHKVECGGKGE